MSDKCLSDNGYFLRCLTALIVNAPSFPLTNQIIHCYQQALQDPLSEVNTHTFLCNHSLFSLSVFRLDFHPGIGMSSSSIPLDETTVAQYVHSSVHTLVTQSIETKSTFGSDHWDFENLRNAPLGRWSALSYVNHLGWCTSQLVFWL